MCGYITIEQESTLAKFGKLCKNNDIVITGDPALLHYNLESVTEYETWRERKLAAYPVNLADNLVHLSDLQALSAQELSEISDKLNNANWLVYESEVAELDKQGLHAFAQQLSLSQFDNHTCADEGVSEISTISPDKERAGFIPYTNRRLKWHTDGYYQPDSHWVSSIILHCNQPATTGGVNQVVDPELLYIHLRDENPDFISALTKPDCFTIPAYETDGKTRRAISHGPVFWFNERQQLQMRYTQRTKHIIWSDDPLLADAMQSITTWLDTSEQIMSMQLQAGQGLLSRNVLHNRTAFIDDLVNPRRLLRARYLDTLSI